MLDIVFLPSGIGSYKSGECLDTMIVILSCIKWLYMTMFGVIYYYYCYCCFLHDYSWHDYTKKLIPKRSFLRSLSKNCKKTPWKLKNATPKNKFSPWKGTIIRTKPSLDGGNSNIFCFHPEPWGRWTQFDEHIFQMGWLKPPTCSFFRFKKCVFSTGVLLATCPTFPPSGFVLHVWVRKLCIFHEKGWPVGEKREFFFRSQVVGTNYGNEIYVYTVKRWCSLDFLLIN